MPEPERRNSDQFETYVTAVAPGPTGPRDLSAEAWERERTAGVQRKDFHNLTIVFSHHDLYHLLKFVEDRAVRAENYAEVRQAVLFSEMIRKQASEQGF